MALTGTMGWLAAGAVVLATALAMEGVAWVVHRYVMHGWGWGWHRSHHDRRDRGLQGNDLYAGLFAGIALLLILLRPSPALYWAGIGMTLYGVLYFLVHDGLVHRRWPFAWVPRRGYLRRLVEAHHLHHAVATRQGCVSFGFLYAPPPADLRRQLRRLRSEAARR